MSKMSKVQQICKSTKLLNNLLIVVHGTKIIRNQVKFVDAFMNQRTLLGSYFLMISVLRTTTSQLFYPHTNNDERFVTYTY